jgi:hypothetical protein
LTGYGSVKKRFRVSGKVKVQGGVVRGYVPDGVSGCFPPEERRFLDDSNAMIS